jgi:hypothetical protein
VLGNQRWNIPEGLEISVLLCVEKCIGIPAERKSQKGLAANAELKS